MNVCPSCHAPFGAEVSFCPHDGFALQPSGRESGLVGRIIHQKYRILSLLGEGGWGQVYLAEHVRMGRRDAIKILSQNVTGSSEAVARFQREALNASRIVHPNVVAIYDFGETGDGLLYLAMEYVEGQTLTRLLKSSGALPTTRALDIVRQVAQALAAAHELEIVHRDLKPDNILVASQRDGTDRVKVVDFGIAKVIGESDQKITRTGFAVGTPRYMSPEQLVGDEVDGRSDLYSLACILYELLTGEQPFVGPSTEMMLRRLTQPPPRIRERNARLPKALDDVVARGMAIKPDDRFQTATELGDAVTAILQGEAGGGPSSRSWGRATATPRPGPSDRVDLARVAGFAVGQGSAGAKPAVTGDGARRRRGRVAALSIGGVVLLAAATATLWTTLASSTRTPAEGSVRTPATAQAGSVSAASRSVPPPAETVSPPQTASGVADAAPRRGTAGPRAAPPAASAAAPAPAGSGSAPARHETRPPPAASSERQTATGAPKPRPDSTRSRAQAVPAPPSAPPPSAVAAIRELIQTGKLLAARADFEEAYAAFGSADSQLKGLARDYPESKEIGQLAQERSIALAQANKTCQDVRMVRLLRNEAAPECH